MVSINKTAFKKIYVLKKEILTLKSATQNKKIDESIAYENNCLKKENNLLKHQDISQKDKIDFLQKEFKLIKENIYFLEKEIVTPRTPSSLRHPTVLS